MVKACENAAILACVAVARLSLWLLPLRVLLRGAQRETENGRPLTQAQESEAARVFHGVSRVARWVPRATCLTQALAARWLLRRRGILTRLCVGVQKDGTALRSHAWLELPGGVCLGGLDAYMKFPLPDAAVR